MRTAGRNFSDANSLERMQSAAADCPQDAIYRSVPGLGFRHESANVHDERAGSTPGREAQFGVLGLAAQLLFGLLRQLRIGRE